MTACANSSTDEDSSLSVIMCVQGKGLDLPRAMIVHQESFTSVQLSLSLNLMVDEKRVLDVIHHMRRVREAVMIQLDCLGK